MRNPLGFHLIELMVVVVIISLLAIISRPFYTEHVVRAKRLAAEVSLIKLASALEKYYLMNNTYQNATLVAMGFSERIPEQPYRFVITSANEHAFTLQAVPVNEQADRDTACGTLEINSQGEKSNRGQKGVRDCWV